MKKLKIIWLCLLFFIGPVYGVSKTITNPQGMMVNARGISLGTTPLLFGEIGNTILNPASISEIDPYPLSITSQSVFGEFDYFVASTGFPKTIKYKRKNSFVRRKIGFSLSYAKISLSNIPEVTTYNNLPYQIGTYDAGFNVVHLAAATNFYERFQFNKMSLGFALKTINYFVDSSSSYTVGLDFGMIARRNLNYYIVSNVDLAASIHNIIVPSISISETGNSAVLPLKYYLGASVNMFSDYFKIHTVLNDLGFNVGFEYILKSGFEARMSTNFDQINYGMGVLIDKIPMGYKGYNLKARLDFAYSQANYPNERDETYVFSITSLGRSIPKQPEILYPRQPVVLISDKETKLTGVGPKNTTMRVFNNNKFYRSTISDRNGNWVLKGLPLFEGENHLYIKSYDISSDFSIKSNEVVVVSDTTPPDLNVIVYPENSILTVFIDSNEELSELTASLKGVKLRFKEIDDKSKKEPKTSLFSVEKLYDTTNIYLNKTRYRALTELPLSLLPGNAPPKDMTLLNVFATDQSGNSIDLNDIEFFGTVSFPVDKHVHYNSSLITIGKSTNMLDAVYINKNKVMVDANKNFSSSVDLEPGKNMIEVTYETKEDTVLTYFTRVLRLLTYPDMNPKVKGRREIEFLSTLGVMFGDEDGNFYPTRPVTRKFLTKLMVLSLEEEVEDEIDFDLFNDVPSDYPYAKYIQTGINLGLIFAFPDGTFRPDQTMTLAEVIYLMSNAGIIGFEEVENPDVIVSRAELAEFLAYTPKFERKIERLIDWNRDYNKNIEF